MFVLHGELTVQAGGWSTLQHVCHVTRCGRSLLESQHAVLPGAHMVTGIWKRGTRGQHKPNHLSGFWGALDSLDSTDLQRLAKGGAGSCVLPQPHLYRPLDLALSVPWNQLICCTLGRKFMSRGLNQNGTWSEKNEGSFSCMFWINMQSLNSLFLHLHLSVAPPLPLCYCRVILPCDSICVYYDIESPISPFAVVKNVILKKVNFYFIFIHM